MKPKVQVVPGHPGRTILTIDGAPMTVVGVTRESSVAPARVKLGYCVEINGEQALVTDTRLEMN